MGCKRRLTILEQTCPCEGCEAERARDAARSKRKRPTRAVTIDVSRISKRERAEARAEYPDAEHERPATRGACAEGERPCPYAACPHHLYLDMSSNGNIKVNFPDLEPTDLANSCALDVADGGPRTLEQVADLMNLQRERVRQIERDALTKLRAHSDVRKDLWIASGDRGGRT